MKHAILLISCPDQKGITAGVTGFICQNNGNIVSADQHIDDQTNTFFMRVEWSLEGFGLKREDIQSGLKPLVEKFSMDWSLYFSDESVRVAIFVSKKMHCLYDLLIRHREGQLPCQICQIVSNHQNAQSIANDFKIPFAYFEINPENKIEQEKRQIELLKKENIELVVLARYQQILTSLFIEAFPSRIINIHHSFLPAFAGGNPYQQAYQKGVKIIGATGHYVIEELDAGSIIEQDTVRVTHRDGLEDLIRKGQDLERVVLSRSLRWYLRRKILCYNNKTVVFE